MILHVLGAGVPRPEKDRFGSSFVLELGNDCLMFDCGPATTYKLVKAGLYPTQIDYLFFTHHHFDHNVDYPCFLFSRWDQGSSKIKRLQVWGPPPTEWITERLIGPDGAFSHDWKARVGHPGGQRVHANRGGSLPRPAPAYDVCDVTPGKVTQQDHWMVTAAKAQHVEPWLESLAYRVDSDQGSIVFAGDTGRCESVIELARGVDVLVMNVWDHQDTMEKNSKELVPLISGTLDAANIAQECGVKKMVVTHMTSNLTRPGSREKGIRDIARVYHGDIIFADELMRLTFT